MKKLITILLGICLTQMFPASPQRARADGEPVLVEVLCGIVIIGGVIYIAKGGCRKIPAHGPANTNAPAPPIVPTNSAPAPAFSVPLPPLIVSVTNSESDTESICISNVFPTLDHYGHPYHTITISVLLSFGPTPLALQTLSETDWWSDTEILTVLSYGNVPFYTGYVARASSPVALEVPFEFGAESYFKPATTNWGVVYPQPAPPMRMMGVTGFKSQVSSLTAEQRTDRARAAQARNDAMNAGMTQMLEDAQAAADKARANRKTILK